MTTDALRRLQALRPTRTGSIPAVLAAVQGDLQTVIEAVLELAGHDDEHEPATDEPAVGEQVTDSSSEAWHRFADGWRQWQFVQHADGSITVSKPAAERDERTTADDRRRVGIPVRDEDASPAPVEAPESDAQSEEVSEDPEPENGPENAAQGRVGWLRLDPGHKFRHLMRPVPGGWTSVDHDQVDRLSEDYPDAEFTPIRTLAGDEVAVKRGVVVMAAMRLEHARRDMLDYGRTATAPALQHAIGALTAALVAGEGA